MYLGTIVSLSSYIIAYLLLISKFITDGDLDWIISSILRILGIVVGSVMGGIGLIVFIFVVTACISR